MLSHQNHSYLQEQKKKKKKKKTQALHYIHWRALNMTKACNENMP